MMIEERRRGLVEVSGKGVERNQGLVKFGREFGEEDERERLKNSQMRERRNFRFLDLGFSM